MKKLLTLALLMSISLEMLSQANIPVDVYVVNPNGCPYSVTTTWSNQYLGGGNGTLVNIDTLGNQQVYHFLVPDSLSSTYFTVCAFPAPPCTCPAACAGPMAIYANISITLLLCPTAIDEPLDAPSISLFPNPANDIINFSSTASITSICFIDLTGRLVKNVFANDKVISVSTYGLTAGVYFVNINFADGNSCRKKVAIE